MPRIRYLKPEFFSDEDLGSLPFQTRLTFEGLWCFADKAGRLEYRPKYLKAMIFPYDNIKIEKEIESLANGKNNGNPFIQLYNIENRQYIQIIQWNRHQRPHHTEKESEIPPAPLLIKEKGMGKGNQLEASKELRNGEVTVKEPLKNNIKKSFGEFNNIQLTEEEKERLNNRYGKEIVDLKIEAFSNSFQSEPKKYNKYKDHYATLNNWIRKDFPKILKEPEKKSKWKSNPSCPLCKKETTQADIDKLGSCPACYKPIPPEKLKQLLSGIGKDVKPCSNSLK